MIKTYTKFIALSFPLFLFSACSIFSGSEVAEAPPSFGNAVEQNIAAQVVNPDAPEVNEAPEHVGGRLAVGQQRYLLDIVEKPDSMKTSDQQGSGGDGGGE